MLKLRRAIVIREDPLTVRVGFEERPAWADEALVGKAAEGDEVIVNTEARDLGLGSGGFDVVQVNLTRGLDAEGAESATAMKLNYSSLQHSVEPIEARTSRNTLQTGDPATLGAQEAPGAPVLVLSLHGQLAPAAWAAGRGDPGPRIGYVQTVGGALPGSLSEDVAELRGAGLLHGHLTAGAAYGGELEALTLIGALQAAPSLGWDAVIAGPGPGIVGSDSELGHGGMAALDTAHASLALGLETLVAPRMSSADPRRPHRGLSHHTETVLSLLLGQVRVPVPADAPLEELRRVCAERHELWPRGAPVHEYEASGLPATHMGRSLHEDPLFFAAALAAGDALAASIQVGAPA